MRAQSPALQRQIYVNWGGSGPSPRAVLREVDRVLTREATLGPFHPKVREEARAQQPLLAPLPPPGSRHHPFLAT